WEEVPNLWGGICNPPSRLKSPATRQAFQPFRQLERTAKEVYDSAMKSYEAEVEEFNAEREALLSQMRDCAKGKAKDAGTMEGLKADLVELVKPEPPIWRRYITNDVTVEKMCDLQSGNPRGILQERDELVGLLRKWDRPEYASDRFYYLEAWNGTGSYTVD